MSSLCTRLVCISWHPFLNSSTLRRNNEKILFRWTIYIHNAWITRDWPREARIICHLLLVNLIFIDKNEVWQLSRCHCKYNGNEKFTCKPLLRRQKNNFTNFALIFFYSILCVDISVKKPWIKMIPVKWYDIISLVKFDNSKPWSDMISFH